MRSRSALARISAFIKAKRRERGYGLRAAAEESGLSPSTLSRLERGVSSSLPDADTLTKLAAWLNISVAHLLSEDAQEAGQASPELTTPEVVEVHLRADKRLSPKTAQALSRMFKILYDQFAEGEGKAVVKR